jgi:hypothetical protein
MLGLSRSVPDEFRELPKRTFTNWTGKVEYLYVDLGSMTTNLNNQQSGMTLTATWCT